MLLPIPADKTNGGSEKSQKIAIACVLHSKAM